ncbi:MAG: choice-of-anchor U domain-containing protein, partial [Pseudomonadota bacterium]
HGPFGFTFSGCSGATSIDASIQYPSSNPAGADFYKYDGTRGWFTIPANISGNTVSFTITDNGPGDLRSRRWCDP